MEILETGKTTWYIGLACKCRGCGCVMKFTSPKDVYYADSEQVDLRCPECRCFITMKKTKEK